jgi:hypothetical protein
MQHGFSGLILIVIVFFLAIAGAGGYYLYNQQKLPARNIIIDESSPTTSQLRAEIAEQKQKLDSFQEASTSADWKTYQDTQFGYSVMYPADWHVYKLKDYPYGGFPGMMFDGQLIITSLSRFPRFSAGDGSGDEYIGVDVTPLDQDLVPIVENARSYVYPSGEKNSVETITVNGYTGYKIVNPDKNVNFYFLYPNKQGGVFLSIASRTVMSQEYSTAEKVIQGFKFVL